MDNLIHLSVAPIPGKIETIIRIQGKKTRLLRLAYDPDTLRQYKRGDRAGVVEFEYFAKGRRREGQLICVSNINGNEWQGVVHLRIWGVRFIPKKLVWRKKSDGGWDFLVSIDMSTERYGWTLALASF